MLEHQAVHDAVTGLPNRLLLEGRVELALAHAHREQSSVAVICLDLDDFRAVNDTLGRAVGDELLRAIAERLLTIVRPADTVACFGGDEFAILLEDVADVEVAVDLATRLVRDFELPVAAAGRELLVRPSCGIAISQRGHSRADSDGDDLIRNADAAMGICKHEGEGGFRVFEKAMLERVLARFALRAELQSAVDLAQFEVHYQPVVGLDDGRARGLEALVRWHHPTRGFVQPAEFIPLAEEMGLIVELGRWVLGEACRQRQQLHQAGEVGAEFVLGVNLSVKQLEHPGIVEDVRAALEASGVDPGTLVLEITETVMMADYEFASRRLQELKALGVRLAMDDFGVGYSSLGYLARLPVDTLKMDRSFLAEHGEDGVSGLAAAIVGLGGNLGLRVIAEGIESAGQYEALRQLGCPLGQGFFIARPMDFATTRDWLATAERARLLAA